MVLLRYSKIEILRKFAPLQYKYKFISRRPTSFHNFNYLTNNMFDQSFMYEVVLTMVTSTTYVKLQ